MIWTAAGDFAVCPKTLHCRADKCAMGNRKNIAPQAAIRILSNMVRIVYPTRLFMTGITDHRGSA